MFWSTSHMGSAYIFSPAHLCPPPFTYFTLAQSLALLSTCRATTLTHTHFPEDQTVYIKEKKYKYNSFCLQLSPSKPFTHIAIAVAANGVLS